MNRIIALAAILCLLVSYQNCSQRANQVDGTLAFNDVTIFLPAGNGSPASDGIAATVSYVEIPQVSNLAIANQKVLGDLAEPRLMISVQTGRIDLVDESNTVLEQRCLNASNLVELKTILDGSKLCEAKASPELMCTMGLVPAYASIYTEESRWPLGEAQDGCGTGSKDICGNMGEVFRSFVSNVKTNWNEMNCDL